MKTPEEVLYEIAEKYMPAKYLKFGSLSPLGEDLTKLISGYRELLALHEGINVYRLATNGDDEFELDENGEKILIAVICEECSGEDVVTSLKLNEWQDGDGVLYPCPTVAIITKALSE